MSKNILFVAVFISCISASLFSQNTIDSQDFDPIKEQIQSWIEAGEVPSLSVAVAQDGELIWKEAFGWADKEKQIQAQPQHIYALGSLAKSMAATGTMTLVEQGKISLDDALNPLIAPAKVKNYHGPASEVQLKHILNMSAGIPHGWTTYPDENFTAFSEKEKNKFLAKIGHVTFPPGKVQQYSNYSYGILDLVMERQSGRSLEAFMQEQVFQPLGMKNSHTVYQRAKADQFVSLYNRNGLVDPYHFLPYGGGGYYSTAEDLIEYGLFYLKNREAGREQIFSDKTIDFMHNYKGAPGMFKIGFFNTGSLIISNGNITGANAMLMMVPEKNIVIVCLTNTDVNSYADQAAGMILGHMLPDFDSGMDREKYAAVFETPYQDAAELLGEWKGGISTIEGNIPLALSCKKGEGILVKVGTGEWKELNNPTFNQYHKLEGSFRAHIPLPEKENQEESRCVFSLHYDEGKLYGHIQSMFTTEDASYSYGVFVSLAKE